MMGVREFLNRLKGKVLGSSYELQNEKIEKLERSNESILGSNSYLKEQLDRTRKTLQRAETEIVELKNRLSNFSSGESENVPNAATMNQLPFHSLELDRYSYEWRIQKEYVTVLLKHIKAVAWGHGGDHYYMRGDAFDLDNERVRVYCFFDDQSFLKSLYDCVHSNEANSDRNVIVRGRLGNWSPSEGQNMHDCEIIECMPIHSKDCVCHQWSPEVIEWTAQLKNVRVIRTTTAYLEQKYAYGNQDIQVVHITPGYLDQKYTYYIRGNALDLDNEPVRVYCFFPLKAPLHTGRRISELKSGRDSGQNVTIKGKLIDWIRTMGVSMINCEFVDPSHQSVSDTSAEP